MAEEKKVRRRRPADAAAGSFQVVGFPKEFEKNYLDEIDVRFASILGTTLFLAFMFILWQNLADHTVTQEYLDAIRQEALKKLQTGFVKNKEMKR